MRRVATREIKVLHVACGDGDRYLKPTPEAVEAMKKSLQEHGQINPISVYQIVRGKYRLIAGATRFRAASALHWDTILATIWSGSSLDFKIHELIENVDRRELAASQRREIKVKIKELQRERMAAVVPAEGGRGHKGGIREAARQMGIPEATARKLRQDHGSDAVSKPRQVFALPRAEIATATSHMTRRERDRLDAWAKRHNLNRSEAMRRIIRERIDAEEENYADERPAELRAH
jgi:hypothetical protein